MKCSLNKLRENFPDLPDNHVLDLGGNSQRMEIIRWTQEVNNRAKALGFRHRPIFRLDGNKLTYNESNNDAYQEFLKDKLYQERMSQELFNEVEDVYIEGQIIKNEFTKPQMKDLFAPPFPNQMGKEELSENNDIKGKEEIHVREESFATGHSRIRKKASFDDWISKREQLLNTLLNTKKKMLRKKVSKDKLIPVNSAIESLERELRDFKDKVSDVEFLKSSVILEINTLDDMLTHISRESIDPTVAASIVDSNQLRERMEVLDLVFGRKTHKDGSKDPSAIDFQDFLPPEDMEMLQGKVAMLNTFYKESIEFVIQKIIIHNDYLTQLKNNELRSAKTEEEKETIEEQFEKFNEKIIELLALRKDNRDKMDGLESVALEKGNLQGLLLGSLSYDSILTEIIAITRDINSNAEAGITNPWKKQLKNSYQDLLKKETKVDGKSVPFADKIWVKDEFGNRTSKVINYIDTDYYFGNTIPKLNIAKKDFKTQKADSKEQAKAYSDWMIKMKNEVMFIDVHKTPEFYNKHKNTSEFKEFLNYSEQEMEAYEAEMKALLGPTIYEIEKRKQIRFVENYLVDAFKTPVEKFTKHPLRFLEHFNKEDGFNVADEETGVMFLPDFAYYIPRADGDAYNQEFKKIAEEGGKSFQDFYEATTELSNYTRDSLASVGEDIQYLEIPDLVDIGGRAAIEEQGDLGKLKTRTREAVNFIFNNDAFYSYRESIDGDADKVQTHYHSFGKKDRQKLVRDLMQQTLPTLLEKAKQLGMKIPSEYDFVENKSLKGDARDLQDERIIDAKYALSQAIALNTYNRKSSMDTYKRILYGAELAESFNTRATTNSMIDLINVYADDRGLSEYRKYIDSWRSLNVTKSGVVLKTDADGKVITRTFAEKNERIKPFEHVPILKAFFKKYGEGEKILKDFFEEERKNLSKEREYDFYYDNVHYYYNPEMDKYYFTDNITNDKGEEVEIRKDQIEAKYDAYLKDKIEKLGDDMTIGGILNGLSWNMFKNLLFFKMKSGFSNRVQGYNQNNQGAASGEHDFDSQALYNSRKFLTGIGLNKLMQYSPDSWNLGLFRSHKKGQLGILMHLAENLNLLNNVVQENTAGDGGPRSISSGFIENMREFTSDFAMNIPEMHNQLELLLSLMQNPKYGIKNKKGELIPLFDVKTMSFPFDPVTMKLLDDFRTPENIANWERFTEDEEGNAPQNVLLQKYSAVRDKLHGNYRTDDKIPLQKSMSGRALATFIKWSFENYDNQWGKKEVSIVNASVDIKGRKVVLATKAPVLATHMLLNDLGIVKSVTTGLSAFSIGAVSTGTTGFAGGIGFAMAGGLGLAALFGGGMAVASGAFIGYQIWQNKKNITSSKRDLGLALNYAREVALRTAYTATNTYSKGYFSPISEKFIKDKTLNRKYLDKYEITERDRAIMSESAQELADKYNTYIGFLIVNMSMLGLYHFLAALNGEDDEEKERNLELLERYEGALKYFTNIRNNLVADTEKWTSGSALIQQYSTSVLYDWINNTGIQIKRDIEKYDNGEYNLGETGLQVGISLSSFFGTPRTITDLAKKDDKWFYNSRVYDTQFNTILDEAFSAAPKSTEDNYEALVKKKRRRVRNVLEDQMEDKIKEYSKKEGIPVSNMKDAVSKNINNYLREQGAYKAGNYDSDEEVYLNNDWNQLEKLDPDFEPEIE